MNTEQQQALMKQFSSIFRSYAKDEVRLGQVNPNLAKHLSRLDLVEIITSQYGGVIPNHLDLVTLENEDLLKLIHSDLFIIAHCTAKWCKELKVDAQSIKEIKVEEKPKGKSKK